MTIPTKELKALLQKSGNRCAFPNCGEVLLQPGTEAEDAVVLSKIAHIVAQSLDGPRGHYPLPLAERDKESNLLLLCGKHHDIIDTQPQLYTVERLRQFKEDHELLILAATGDAIAKRMREDDKKQRHVRETLFSTLFPAVEFPTQVYGAPSKFVETQRNDIRTKIMASGDETVVYPYIIRNGMLYAFQDLGSAKGPFRDVVDHQHAESYRASTWWDDSIRYIWFVDLLNRSLHKLTGRRNLQWDKDHYRYYFQPDKPGEVKEVSYRPLNQTLTTKQVVWQPISKRTGQPRPYWLHRAVNLKFHRVTANQWCLSIRPEFRVTKDGFDPEDSEKIGARVTRKKSRMFNYDLLGEVNFWRDYLSGSGPRIIINFGRGQHIIVSTTMMQTEIDWPGMPEEFARPFKNIDYAEDLFTWAELAGLQADFDEFEDDEEHDNQAEDI